MRSVQTLPNAPINWRDASMINLVVVGFGGFLGAIARYCLSGLVHRHLSGSFPAGTLVVNVLGCFIIGVLMTLIQEREFISANARLFLTVGLLGSFTTFSTLGYETFELMKSSDYRLVFYNIAANLVLGIGAVALGRGATKLIVT